MNSVIGQLGKTSVPKVTIKGPDGPVTVMTASAASIDTSHEDGVVRSKFEIEDSPVSVAVPSQLLSIFGDRAAVVVQTFNASVMNKLFTEEFLKDSNGQAVTVKGVMSIDIIVPEETSSGRVANVLSVQDLQDPIVITLDAVDGECAVWERLAKHWTSEGIVTSSNSDGTRKCSVRHLSLFGAIISEFGAALSCANGNVITPKGIAMIGKGDWWQAPASWMMFLFIFLHIVLLIAALTLDFIHWMKGMGGFDNLMTTHPNYKPGKVSIWVRLKHDSILIRMIHMMQAIFASFTHSYSPMAKLFESLIVNVTVLCIQMSASAKFQLADDDLDRFVRWGRKIQKKKKLEKEQQLYESQSVKYITESECPLGLDRYYSHSKHDVANQNGVAGESTENAVVPLQATENGAEDAAQQMKSARVIQNGPSQGGLSSKDSFSSDDIGTVFCDHHEKLRLYLQQHVTDFYEGSVSTQMFGKRVWLFMNAFQPWLRVLSYSVYSPASTRALLVVDRVFGGLMLAALFFSTAGGSVGAEAPPECTPRGFWKSLFRSICIGIISSIVGSIPAILLIVVSMRDIVYVAEEDDSKRRSVIRKWYIQNLMIWFFGSAYACFDALFCLSFLANVTREDSYNFLVSAAISLFKELFITPLAVSVCLALTTLAAPKFPDLKPCVEEKLGVRKSDEEDQVNGWNSTGSLFEAVT